MANTNRNRRNNQSSGQQQNQDWENKQRVSRDNDNQDYESFGSEHLDYEQGDQNRYLNTSGYGHSRMDLDQEGFGYHTNAGQYDNYGTQRNQESGQNEWQRRRNVTNQQQDWRDRRSNSGNYGSNRSQRNMYGGDTSNYGNASQGGMDRDRDRDWWDRTRDQVSSWFGDDEAKRRREVDKKHQGKGPRGYQRSEDRIREDVNDRLTDDPYIDASDIDVKIEQNVVILSGTVDNREDKRRAEDLIERISGVKDVENRLRVKTDRGRSDSNSRGDREIENFK